MAQPLFNETYFKKNNYFRDELGLSQERLKEIKTLIINWQKNCESFNPDTDKETTDENEFVELIFKKILGYVGKGQNSENYHIFPKFKIEGAGVSGGAGFADLALGNFSKNASNAEIVLEFKDQNSNDLTKTSQRKDKLSPVDQCWKYLVNHPTAKWGIVTNFNEIRIYNREKGQNTFETFFFNVPIEYKDKYLPLSTETELLKFITLLKRENLLTSNGISQTEELLKVKGIEETKVQKEFYLAYKNLRSQIFYEALKHNPQYEEVKTKSELLQLVQKLLDRIIFCWFCEDSREHLIPSNIFSNDIIQSQIQDKYYNPQHFSIYGKVKDLFQAIDEGKAFGIENGYNGELFKPDSELDALKLPNFLFEKIAEIGMHYDFGDENELNVNILGHIFEQSISDLEEMRVSFQEYDQSVRKNEKQMVMEFAQEFDVLDHKHITFDAKKTKRKKEGVFYTPDYITRYIVENTVGVWLKEKEAEVTKKYSTLKKNKEYTILREYRDEYLSQIKILDPACGSGAFLIAAFNYLWAEHERVYSEIKEVKSKTAQGELFDFDSISKTILENNLYGVDLNRESVEITKLALWLKTAAKNKKLNSLHNNIKCGNSLIDDPAVAGDLAFDWKKEFSSIMKAGGFDVVVGNPPYTYRNSIDDNYKNYFSKNFTASEGNFDLYKFFMEKTLSLTNNGLISLIVPNTFLSATTYLKLRNLILTEADIEEIFDLGLEIFENVVVESVIYKLNKNRKKENTTIIKIQRDRSKNILNYEEIYKIKIKKANLDEYLSININISPKVAPIIKKIKQDSINLGDVAYCTVGINTGYIKSLITSDKKIDYRYHKMLNGKDIGRNKAIWGNEWIMYDPEFVKSCGDKGRSLPPEYIFQNEKILVQRTRRGMDRKLICYYDKEKYYNLNRLSNIVIKNEEYDLKYIYIVLNSSLLDFYFNISFNEYEVKPVHLSLLPIKNVSQNNQKPFIQLADIMLTKNKDLQEIQKNFTTLLVAEFKIEKLTEKLEDWYLLEWSEFANELKKKKITLTSKDEEKWLDRFERMKKEAQAIKDVIDSTDKKIDAMVYELYGLTKEEIKIVEGMG